MEGKKKRKSYFKYGHVDSPPRSTVYKVLNEANVAGFGRRSSRKLLREPTEENVQAAAGDVEEAMDVMGGGGSPSPRSSHGPEPPLFLSSSSHSSLLEVPLTQREDDFDDLENESISSTDLDYIGLRQRLADVEADEDDSSSERDSDDSSVPTDVIFASDELLYEGARITSKEAVVMLYGIVFRHNLTKECTDDFLKFLHVALPRDTNNLPTSKYLLEKALNVDFSKAKKQYYCSTCEGPLSSEEETPLCVDCNTRCSLATLDKHDKFFFLLDIREVLTFVLETDPIAEEILEAVRNRELQRNQCDVFRDVVDGACYKSLGLSGMDLSCQINTDGVRLFKSGENTVWPIFISINEMSFKKRRSNTLLVALWFGGNKPNFSTYLKPFVNLCNDLYNTPLRWTHKGQSYESRFCFPLFTADSAARPLVQGFKQHNGYYGCPWCLCPGERYQTILKQVYSSKSLGFAARTDAFVRQHLPKLKQVLSGEEKNRDATMGLILSSPMTSLIKMDMVQGFPYDYMHGALLGVVKRLTNTILDATRDKLYSLTDKQRTKIERRWTCVRVSSGTDRRVRPFESVSVWKAHEWKTWLLVWIPILKGIIDDDVLNLLAQFTLGILLLLQDSITKEEIVHSRELLTEFCERLENFFGIEECTFNVHILSHISTTVENWGPLWAYSLFQYEAANGRINHYFKGARKVSTQIVQKAIIHQEVLTTSGHLAWSEELTYFVERLLNHRLCYKQSAMLSPGIYFAGPKKAYNLSEAEERVLEPAFITSKYGWRYKHAIVHGFRFDIPPKSLKKALSCNSVFTTSEGGLYFLDTILLIQHKGFFLCRKLPIKEHMGTDLDSFAIKVGAIGRRVMAVPVDNVLGYKYHVTLNHAGDINFVSKLPNTREVE